MQCPSCGTPVADDAAVCPKCDHILDPSLFSDEPPPERPKKTKSSTGTSKAVKRTATGTSGVRKPAPSAPAAKKDPPPRRMMPDAPGRRVKPAPDPAAEDWHVEKSERVAPAAPRGESQVLDPEEAMADARNFLVALSFSDRIAFAGGIFTLVACFLPWRETVDEGDSLGLLSLGALVAVASVVLLSAVVIRVQKAMPKLNALVPWLMQFGASAFSIVWCLVLIKLAVNTQKARALYGNEEVWTSKPGIGVLIALLTSIAAFAGTLMGLREKPD